MIGVFIGSFNPITKAHIDICLKLQNTLEKIVLVPVNSQDKELIDINKRIDMLNIIKRKYLFIEISDIMKKYSYLNFRIIDLLKKEYGNINIIMGSDLLEKFDNFDNFNYLLDNYTFTVVPRNNMNVKEMINNKFSKYQDKFNILDYQSNISSTMVKKLLKENRCTKEYLDQDILDYIKDNELY